MKRFLILLSLLFCHTVYADTINLHWLNEDGSVYQNSTCTVDGDLNIPSTPPTKYGYTFTGWKIANYVPIEYLESTGTQYIDTGIVPTDSYGARAIFYPTDLSDKVFVGVSTGLNRFYVPYFTNNKIIYGWGELYQVDLNNIVVQTKHEVLLNFQNSRTVQVDNYLNQNLGALEGITQRIFVFGRNANGTTTTNPVRLYSLQISSGTSIVRDFIPVLDENGTPCMYDKVTRQFFYNAGTGQFIAGPVLQ